MIAPSAAWAQQASANARRFAIPAQSLPDALVLFGRQAGVDVTAESANTRGRTAQDVSGNMAPAEALSQLLAGSGLTFRWQSSRSVVIEPAPQAANGAIQLGPVRIEGETGDGAQTRSVGSSRYGGEIIVNGVRPVQGNRLGQSVISTPRAVSIVTRDLIDDVKPFSETELFRYVAGITQRTDYQGLYSSFMLRGLMAENGTNFLRDGARVFHLTEPLLFNVESIEVIKGPNAIDYGQTAPGGLINYVSKKPLPQPRHVGRLSIGGNDWHRGELDLTGPIDQGGTLLYRLTGQYEKGGAFTDYVDPTRWGGALSLSWKATEDTTLNMSVEHNDIRQLSNPGLPVPDPADIRSADAIRVRNFYGETTFGFHTRRTYYQAELVHMLSDDWQIRVQVARDNISRPSQYLVHDGLTADRKSARRTFWYNAAYDVKFDTVRADARGTFDTGPLHHRLLAGIDHFRNRNERRKWVVGSLSALDLYDPAIDSTPLPVPGDRDAPGDNRDWGIFLQDVIDFGGGWGLQLGLRHDRVRDRIARETASKTSPNASFTFKPDEHSLLYVSYASSFEPNYGADLAGGGRASPSQGKQVEFGAKRTWLDGRIATTAAVFQLEKTNILTGSASNPGFSEVTGKVRIRGIELEANGEPLPGLNLIAQATFLDPKVIYDGDAALVGKQLERSTRTTASAWATYRLPGALDKVQIGGGVTYKGTTPVDDINAVKAPAYTVADAFIGWNAADDIRLSLNVRNVTDKRHYVDANARNGGYESVNPGVPRSVLLTLETRF